MKMQKSFIIVLTLAAMLGLGADASAQCEYKGYRFRLTNGYVFEFNHCISTSDFDFYYGSSLRGDCTTTKRVGQAFLFVPPDCDVMTLEIRESDSGNTYFILPDTHGRWTGYTRNNRGDSYTLDRMLLCEFEGDG